MSWSQPAHAISDQTVLRCPSPGLHHLTSITWPPSNVSKFIFEKKNEPFCYLSHPEVFFKHQSWAFPGSNPSCALWPRQPSFPIKQISKSLSISDLHSPPWAQGPELRRGENGQMEIYGDNTLTHPGQDCGLTYSSTNCNIWCGDISVESRPGNVDVD